MTNTRVPPGSPEEGQNLEELTEYQRMQTTPEFADLRRRFRGFVFPMTAFFLIWYFLYVLLAAYAPGFMSTRVFGLINIGLILGFLQFVTTFGITILYVRWADRVLDPRSEAIRREIEGV